jgi:hypothetical protein
VLKTEAGSFATGIGATYWEVSAKSGLGVDDLFRKVAQAALSEIGRTSGIG